VDEPSGVASSRISLGSYELSAAQIATNVDTTKTRAKRSAQRGELSIAMLAALRVACAVEKRIIPTALKQDGSLTGREGRELRCGFKKALSTGSTSQRAI
jgi:hypothetical protein